MKQMGLAGLVLLVLGVSALSYFSVVQRDAEQLDAIDIVRPDFAEDPGTCERPLDSLVLERNVVAINDSFVVTAILEPRHLRGWSVENTDGDAVATCTTKLYPIAPEFVVTPDGKLEVTLSINERTEVAWVLSPRKLGTHAIVVYAEVQRMTKGVTVTNTLGLSAAHAQIASWIISFFGPALTFPWLFNLWKARRETKTAQGRKKD
jgi:hypothetical protein